MADKTDAVFGRREREKARRKARHARQNRTGGVPRHLEADAAAYRKLTPMHVEANKPQQITIYDAQCDGCGCDLPRDAVSASSPDHTRELARERGWGVFTPNVGGIRFSYRHSQLMLLALIRAPQRAEVLSKLTTEKLRDELLEIEHALGRDRARVAYSREVWLCTTCHALWRGLDPRLVRTVGEVVPDA